MSRSLKTKKIGKLMKQSNTKTRRKKCKQHDNKRCEEFKSTSFREMLGSWRSGIKKELKIGSSTKNGRRIEKVNS